MLTPIISALIAVLVGLGVGSGGLFIIYLTAALSLDQLSAQGANLLFFLAASLGGIAVHLFCRRVRFRLLLPFLLLAIPGALLGAFIAGKTDPSLLKRLFGGLMLLSGGIALFKK